MTGLLQIVAIVLLILSAGGVSFREFASDVTGAIEVIRRGGEEKEIIVPLKGEVPKPRQQTQSPAPPVGLAPTKQPEDDTSLPLE